MAFGINLLFILFLMVIQQYVQEHYSFTYSGYNQHSPLLFQVIFDESRVVAFCMYCMFFRGICT